MNPIERFMAWLNRLQLRADLKMAERSYDEAVAAQPYWANRISELRSELAMAERPQ